VSARSGDFRRILLIRRKALGDALVSLPAVAAVADAWPGAQIDLVVDRPLAALFAGLARNVNVLAYPHADGRPWLPWLRGQRYDLVIDWLGSPRTALWTALSGARVRVGYDLPRRRWAYNLRVPRNRSGAHRLRGFAGEAFLDPLRALGLTPEPWSPAAERPPANGPTVTGDTPFGRWLRDWRSGPEARRAVLVMSATWSAKAWPARHVAGLWRQLEADGVHAVLAPGPGDGVLVEDLRADLPPRAFAPPTSLAEMAELLRNCDVFIGTDNGLRHLAALLGVPTVTVFGPTDPAGWNPPGPRHVCVRRGESCSPCDLTECPVPGRPCLENLGFEPVAAAAMELLRAYGPARAAAGRSAGPRGKATTC
jgi:ADP-heptose:LPS heptosyltransferase